MPAKSQELSATLVRKNSITDNLFTIWVKPQYEIPDFQSGQYVAIGLLPEHERISGSEPETEEHRAGKLIKRTYSIGSAPHEKDALEFYIALVPEGSLTPRLANLKEGDPLWIAPKITGTFTLEGVPSDANLVFMATGTGLAPFTSMLRTEELWEDPSRTITLIQGVRYEDDLGYQDELKELSEKRENFNYFQTVSRPGEDFEGTKGYVQDFIHRGEIRPDPSNTHVFLCGNPAMIESVEELLTAKGFKLHARRDPGNLHLEKYW